MSIDWETTFSTWAKGPSQTEQDRAENAERQIKAAINSSPKLKHRKHLNMTQNKRKTLNIRPKN